MAQERAKTRKQPKVATKEKKASNSKRIGLKKPDLGFPEWFGPEEKFIYTGGFKAGYIVGYNAACEICEERMEDD